MRAQFLNLNSSCPSTFPGDSAAEEGVSGLEGLHVARFGEDEGEGTELFFLRVHQLSKVALQYRPGHVLGVVAKVEDVHGRHKGSGSRMS